MGHAERVDAQWDILRGCLIDEVIGFDDGLRYGISSGVPEHWSFAYGVSDDPAIMERQIGEIRQVAAGRGLHNAAVLFNDAAAEAFASRVEVGFRFEGYNWMTLKASDFKDRDAGSLRIAPLTTPAQRQDFLDLFRGAYIDPCKQKFGYETFPDSYLAAIEKGFDAAPAFTHYMGYEGDRPVAIISVGQKGDRAGIYNVGVADCARQGGYGGKILCHAIREAIARGAGEIDLQTTDQLRTNFYEKHGFRTVFRGTGLIFT